MDISLREISYLLLKAIAEALKNEQPGAFIEIKDMISKPEFNKYKQQITEAINLLEDRDDIACLRTNDGNIYAVKITKSGKLYLEKSQFHKTKDILSEIENYAKDLISESNPDRPDFIEDTKTNAYNSRVNDFEEAEDKINFLMETLKAIERYFLNKWENSALPPSNSTSGEAEYDDKRVIKNFPIYRKIEKMISEVQKDPSIQFWQEFKSYPGAMESLMEYGIEYNKLKREKIERVFEFDFEKIKKYGNSLTDLKERLLYYDYVKKEYIQNKKYTVDLDKPNDSPFMEKLEIEIVYVKTQIDKKISIGPETLGIKKIESEREFYNDHCYDIIAIANHVNLIQDIDLKIAYLDWLLKDADERYQERLANLTEVEKQEKKNINGFQTYRSII